MFKIFKITSLYQSWKGVRHKTHNIMKNINKCDYIKFKNIYMYICETP